MPRRKSAPAPVDTGFTFGGAILFIIKLIIFIYILRALLPYLMAALGAK